MNLINTLQETKAALREALAQAGALEYKFLGPRPKDGAANPAAPQNDSVANLINDVKFLSVEIVKVLAAHHSVVGDFMSEDSAPQPQQLRRG
jgi:hypothetical protein